MNAPLHRRLLQRVRRVLSGAAGRRHSLVGPAHLWRMKRQFQIDFLRAQGLQPQHRLIDIGCGTLRGGVPLIRYLEPGHYTGLEVRAEALEEARKELAKEGLEPRRPQLVQSEDFDALELEPADYLWAFAVLIHMDDPVLERCIAFAARHMAPGGQLLATANLGPEGATGRWAGFPVMRHGRDFYEQLAARHGLRLEDLGSLAELGHRDESPLPPESRRMFRFTRA